MKNVIIIKIIVIFIFLITTISCENNKKVIKNNALALEVNKLNGKELLAQKCYICHSVTSKSHDAIIAPPMVAVKRRYLSSYTTENEFVEAVTNWVLNPTEENALMYGAVQNFKVMPKQPFNKEEIIKIATYMFHNELEKPSWFQKHFNEEHPNGMGNGKRRRKFRNN